MLDCRRKANSVGTHGRWREMHLVPILKEEEWGLNRNDGERASGQRKEYELRDEDQKITGCLEEG